MRAMVAAWKAGLVILNQVHDEINITSSNPEKDAILLEKCMVEAMKLTVPSVVDIGIGSNWYAAKEH